MAYGVKYRLLFADLKGNTCRFDISQKEYFSYDIIPLLASESPVIVEYEAGDTDILKPVRGCSATVSYINVGGSDLYVVTSEISEPDYTLILTGTPNAGDSITVVLVLNNDNTETYTYTFSEGDTLLDGLNSIVSQANAGPIYTAVLSGTTGIIFTNYAISFTIASATPTISNSSNIPLSAFFSENDDEFLGELYINDALKFKGLLVQDDCQESFNAPPYPVELKFNDGLGLLSQLSLSNTILSPKIAGKESVAGFFYAILQLTGLDMPIEIYNNVFESRMDDRSYEAANDAFVQTFLKTASFKEENAYQDCFAVLEKLLLANDCVLFQADGSWVIMRWPELARFNNDIPGSVLELDTISENVLFQSLGGTDGSLFQFSGNYNAGAFAEGQKFRVSNSTDPAVNGVYTVWYLVTDGGSGSDLIVNVYEMPYPDAMSETIGATFSSLKQDFNKTVAGSINQIDVYNGGDLVPIEFTQIRSLRRGYRYVQRTFDINTPDLIRNQNLQELGPFIATSTDGDFTYNDYGMIGWNEQEPQYTFIRVVTETATGDEKNRYIVIKWEGTASVNDLPSSAIITPKIEVQEKDKWNFSCSYRSSSNLAQSEYFGVSFYLRPCGAGNFKRLTRTNNVDPSTDVAYWSTYLPFSPFDPGAPPPPNAAYRAVSLDKTQWADFSSSLVYDPNNFGLPAFPYDGTLEIAIYGLNNWNGTNPFTRDAYVKELKFEYFYFITDTTTIDGQIHTSNGNPDIKNILTETVFIDDMNRQNVGGTMYLDDSPTCSVLTERWKTASANTNLYRFGQIQTSDRLGMNQKTRLRIEGDFYMNTIPSMKDIIAFQYGGLFASTFIISRASFDFKRQVVSATLDEAWNTGDENATDLAAFDYEFKFKFKENGN